MINSAVLRVAFPAAVAAISLSACGGGAPANLPAATAYVAAAAHAESWLYTQGIGPSGTGVYAYRFPQGKVVRKVAGYFGPLWMCVDGKGDLFLVNLGIFEYRPGGSALIKTLKDRFSPGDCAVDASSGDLAVSNTSRHGASVAIYKHAAGLPAYYTDPDLKYIRSLAFDERGDLFVDGYKKGQATFAELQRGANRFVAIDVSPAIAQPAEIRWDGSDLAVGIARSNLIRRVAISNGSGHVVGTTRLDQCRYTDFVLLPGSVAAACGDVRVFAYPQGGAPIEVVRYLLPGAIVIAIGK